MAFTAGKGSRRMLAASKNILWWDAMMEFDCKVTSTWSSCEERKEMAHTHNLVRRAKYRS